MSVPTLNGSANDLGGIEERSVSSYPVSRKGEETIGVLV